MTQPPSNEARDTRGGHTPGIWTVENEWSGSPVVAQIATPGVRTYVVARGYEEFYVPAVEQRANAHLISAAPDLLRALNCAPTDVDYGSHDEFVSALGAWWSDLALPAIKKAEGA